MKVLVLGRGSGRQEMKTPAAYGQRDPGDVQVYV